MTTRNHRIRFMENNFAELISASISYSSQLSSFPFDNAVNKFRSRVWKPSGYFEFSTEYDNNKIYINDGINKEITLNGSYATPALAAAHIQTQLNASSANWTVTYDVVSETYKFTISNSGSVILRLSEQTSSAWNTLGYTLTTDQTGTSFEAQEQRNHLHEKVTFDLGYNATITFFALIGPLNEVFSISNNASVVLLGSNLNQWSNPPFSVSLPITDLGAIRFLDDYDDTGYRFWRVLIEDKQNPNGPSGFSIGHLYIGDYITLSNRNINIGFEKGDIDPSDIIESEAGVLHYDTKTKYSKISSASIGLLNRSDKDVLTSMFNKLGKTTPFFISLDPLTQTTSSIDELTKYVVFSDEPKFRHIINDIYSMSMSFREVV